MKKLISNLLVLIAIFFGARFALQLWTGNRFMEHFNECHAQLHIGERAHQPMSKEQSDAMYAEFEKCVKDRSNFVDLLFMKNVIEGLIEAEKKDPHLNAR